MNKNLAALIISITAALMLSACIHRRQAVPEPRRAVYYWRTVFRLDTAEREFLARNHVEKIYMRYFDVVAGKQGQPAPNATIRFGQAVPRGIEVVPTVFVMNDCLSQDTAQLARRIVERVVQMNATNDIAGVKELQIDCDWTRSTQQVYFAFLRQVNRALQARGMRLSVTIRLHQLAMTPPPCDYGVLMMYNTGDLTRAGDRNPILDPRDVEPYLRHIAAYKLPLCAAYPIFSIKLLFAGTTYKNMLYDADLGDTLVFRRVAPQRYVVISSRDMPSSLTDDDTHVYVGDSVIVRQVPAAVILAIHDELERRRPGINDQVIVYDLESSNINHYQQHDYEKIYHP